MATSGRPISRTFTPALTGRVKVSISFNAEGLGSDWGASRRCDCFLEQAGTTTYGGGMPVGSSRLPYTVSWVFPVVAGLPVTCGLFGAVTGASSLVFYDLSMVTEVFI
jgi:hypothetical protein